MAALPCLFALFFLVAAVSADDYNVDSVPAPYGAVESNVQIQQFPIYGKSTYNVGLYPNVRKGRHHGAFTDVMYKKSSESRSDESDSDSRSKSTSESSESHEHRRHSRRHHRHHHPSSYQYPVASGWPYQQVLSNPYFVPERRYHNYHKGRRYGRRNHHY